MSSIFLYRPSSDNYPIEPSGRSRTRLDVFLVDKLGKSRSQVADLIRQGRISVNGKPAKKAEEILKIGDTIEIQNIDSKDIRDIKKDIQDIQDNRDNLDIRDIADKIEVIGETPDYIVVNKPAGLLVHPTQAGEPDTLVSWLLDRYPEIKSVGEPGLKAGQRAGIVHRLDKEASGALIIARTQAMYDHLKKQFQDRTIDKEYMVLAHGRIAKDYDSIDFAIDRGEEGRMVARPRTGALTLRSIRSMQTGKEAKTEFWVEKRLANMTLLSVKIHTGRMHQIRVHLFAYNHPVIGDPLYRQKQKLSKSEQQIGRLFLHAKRLCFDTLSGERVCYEAPLPKELETFLQSFV